MEKWKSGPGGYGALIPCRNADGQSDDVSGRTKIYDSIMQGKNELEAGIPESFNVLLREMMSLCLDVRIRRTKNTMA